MTLDPQSAHPFALERLTPDEWEELTFLLAWGEDRRVERLKAPDGGLDTVLPRPGESLNAERGWQAKHFAGQIHWEQCEASLDRAVERWAASRVTFTFPRDLNHGERATFARRLASRHDGVVVDLWSGSDVRARLSADEAGERAARRFFGHFDAVDLMERAMRAGGELSRGEHAVEREFAVDEFVQGADPHFQWAIHKTAGEEPEPPLAPGAILRLLFSRDDLRIYVDAVPRHASSVEHHGPRVTLIPEDSEAGEEVRRLLDEVHAGGGRLRLKEGLQVSLDQVPKPFGDLFAVPLTGEVTVKAIPVAEPWFARLEAESDLGSGSVDIDLAPVDAPDEWDSEWRGSKGGLELDIRARWSVNERRGQTALQFRYQGSRAPNSDRLAALRATLSLHGAGVMRLVDRTGKRTTMEQPTERRPVQDALVPLLGLVEALVEIEGFSGQPAPAIPDEVSSSEIEALRRAANLLRAGGQMARIREATFTGTHEMVRHLRSAGNDIKLQEHAFIEVFGEEIAVGERVTHLPLMAIKEVRRAGPKRDDPWKVVLVPVHAVEAEAWMEFRPLGSSRPTDD